MNGSHGEIQVIATRSRFKNIGVRTLPCFTPIHDNLCSHAGMESLQYDNKGWRAAKFVQNVTKKVSVDCIK